MSGIIYTTNQLGVKPVFKVNWKMNNGLVLTAVKQAMLDRFYKIGLQVERHAKSSMGRYGKIGSASSSGMTSKPGYPPNVQTGTLKANIVTVKDKSTMTVVVGPKPFGADRDAWYGRLLEYGSEGLGAFVGRNRTYWFPARPFMHPAYEAVVGGDLGKPIEDLDLANTPAGRTLNKSQVGYTAEQYAKAKGQ